MTRAGIVGLALVGCARHAAEGVHAGDDPGLVVMHTNDAHAHLPPSAASWLAYQMVGGARATSAEIEAVRQAGEPSVLLDAGDLVSGTPLDEYSARGVSGGAMLDWLAAARYDAWTIGNHEFDRGVPHASALVAASPVPVLGANLEGPNGPAFEGLRDGIVLERGDLRIGVVGITTPELARLSGSALGDITVSDPATQARDALVALGEVDLRVALTHLGVDADRSLAEAVPELDLIVGGHTHTRLDAPIQVGQTWIVQAGSYLQGLGVARLKPEEGNWTLHWTFVTPGERPAPGPPAAEVAALADRWETQLATDWGGVVGTATHPLDRAGAGESALGRWVTEAMRRAAGADVAVTNRTGLRADLAAGPITREALYAIAPFGNALVTVDVPGSVLLDLALRNATAQLDPTRGRLVEQSGLTYTFEVAMGSPQLVTALVGGQPIDPTRTYTMATTDFLIGRWPRTFAGPTPTAKPLGLRDLDALEAAAAAGPVSPPPQASVRLP
jgi:2',3'-cyclic-nucleotide 2'-phosphodiesterase (5'-nucleotidase family)